MDKENNRSAAGLRRSAVAERIRLREEWSQLKGIDNKPLRVLDKKSQNIKQDVFKKNAKNDAKKQYPRPVTSDVLYGVVALVEVGAENRALALRAALNALGATVVPVWSPLVTHLVWAQGGCRATRGKARALASRLVSPLWVEACAAAGRRLAEQTFPAAARASDLPSPRTLRRLLKQAERDNIPLADLLSDSKDEDGRVKTRLRMSSETEQDTSHDKSTDTSHNKTDTTDGSRDTSNDTIDVESRVNTAPRRALPVSITPPPQKKSRRKLFTQKEAPEESHGDTSEEDTTIRRTELKVTQNDRKALARAERMAKRLAANTPPKKTRPIVSLSTVKPKIVLTGMSRTERSTISKIIQELGGKMQCNVNKKTTHVLLGSCRENQDINETDQVPTKPNQVPNITGVSTLTSVCNANHVQTLSTMKSVIPNSLTCPNKKARTLNTLLGAARGCRVLHGQWAIDSFEAKKWLHHNGYEVQHLKKISEKALVERKAILRMKSEYAYDVFFGMRIRLSATAEQKDAVKQLLTLCGAILIEEKENGALSQSRGQGHDIVIGTKAGEISSKWVFDSVAAARMRTTRRYVNLGDDSEYDMIEQLLRSMSA